MTQFTEGFGEGSLDELDEGIEVAAIDFSATWCGPCRRQDPVFKRVARAFLDERPDAPVAFLLVDIDENGELARRRTVRSVPTTLVLAREERLIFGEGWRERSRFSGVVPYPRLVEAVEDELDD